MTTTLSNVARHLKSVKVSKRYRLWIMQLKVGCSAPEKTEFFFWYYITLRVGLLQFLDWLRVRHLVVREMFFFVSPTFGKLFT